MEEEFKPFHLTYKFIMFFLSFGMMYPNPATDRWRLLAIPLVIMTVAPVSTLILMDSYRLWMEGHILEVIRHVALIGPFLAGFLKMYFLYRERVVLKNILDTINADYASYNHCPENYKEVVRSYIKNTKLYHMVWIVCVLMILSTFVGTATILNFYEHLFKSEPKKHMIYEFNLPLERPEARFETPYFEIFYFYLLYIAILYVLNFTGYDGLMTTSLNHVCLRIDLFCMYLHDSMKYEGEELKRRLANVVNAQCETFKLIEWCQRAYNSYLGLIYLVVTTELCVCLYLMTEGYEFEYKFSAFSVGTVLHIYVPCHIADKVKSSCENAAVMIYCCGWENMYDLSARRYIVFMMARAQYPVSMKAFGIVTYEMDLFVKTMKTAYSLYTLIKTQ